MKRVGVLLVVLVLIWSFVGTAKKDVYLQGKEVAFRYSGIDGTISIEAQSDNYSYRFSMDAGSFSGYFSGDSLSFAHDYSYENGQSLSLVQTKDGTIGSVATVGEDMGVSERFSTSGNKSMLWVHVAIEAEDEKIEEEKGSLPPPKPMPVIVSGYLRDDQGNIIGGYFENIGNADFKGEISFRAGLSYSTGWVAESVAQFLKGSSPLMVLKPKDRIEFLIVPTPGAYTFVFPSIIQNDLPISFSVASPPADAPAVENFKDMIYNWWTGYKDPEPDVDYIYTKVVIDKKGVGFFFPIQPYFPPPR